MIVLADSGGLLALLLRRDVWHERVRLWWSETADEILVPTTVLPEVSYILGKRVGFRAEARFVRSLADDDFQLEQHLPEDYSRTAAIAERYADLPLGFVGATVIAIAERLGAEGVLTTDRRHFGVVRPLHVERFALLP